MNARHEPMLPHGPEWEFEVLEQYDAVIARTAAEFGLDTYPNQIEIINSEQMLDAYASSGLPLGYPHWSYGKAFIRHEQSYRKGYQGLAYEIVINSDPCIAYLMEENSLTMQALVIAHASYGHNSFFKGNYLFRQFTQADAILDYLVFARRYVMECEERYGTEEVENVIDSCHALMSYGVDRYRRPQPHTAKEMDARREEIAEHERRQFNDLWRTVPVGRSGAASPVASGGFPGEPEENILYFVEKFSPRLAPWQRELVRIVRKLSQYFYPQTQTKVMNEGWATFWHYTLLNRLYEKRVVDEAFMIEFLHHHTNVVGQRGFDQQGYHGMNPYALGFAMMQDIRRICEKPTDEDREWFPDLVDTDWVRTLDFAMRNFKDESFISQYLSPRLIREFRLFVVADHADDDMLEIDSIHDEHGYRRVRRMLAEQYKRENLMPDIQVVRFDRDGDRSLTLRNSIYRGRPLRDEEANEVLRHLGRLWGFTVRLEAVDAGGRIDGFREWRP
ncbi:MAG: SpoVR family protein [Betaproteobacteria bacterium]|nr:SpoVR family protein [Betaproteobacteria bacterium]